jgi:DNA-binding transcriptional ArsR family regulator
LKPITDIDDPRYVKALAHPLRIRILAMLADRSASPVQLSSQLDATLGTVAYHVRTLHNLGLVELVDTRQRRGATEHYYRAREHPRFPDDAWAGLAPVAKQRMLSAMLQQIGQYVTASAAAGGFDRSEAHMSRRSLHLDDRGFEELAAATRTWLEAAEKIGAAAAERLSKNHAGGDGADAAVDTGLVVMLFEGRPVDDAPPSADGDGRVARRTAAVGD